MLVAAAWALQASAEPPAGLDAALTEQLTHQVHQRVQQLAQQALSDSVAEVRLAIEIGRLDPRLKLAPCAQITPFLPAGTRLWGASRVGLRCDAGARWSVYLPVRVKVFAPALVLAQAMPAGATIEASHLRLAEVDLAAERGQALRQDAHALGRMLNRPLPAGAALRATDLRPRQWFAAGDTVRIVARGPGYQAVSEGQALSAGIEGQAARVRTESGRIVTGRPSAARQLDLL